MNEERTNSLRGLSPLEQQIAQTALAIHDIAESISTKFQGAFLQDIEKMAQKRKEFYEFQARKSGKCSLMNELRKRIADWSYDECIAPKDLEESIPSSATAIRNALDRIIQYDQSSEIAWIAGEYRGIYALYAKLHTTGEKRQMKMLGKKDLALWTDIVLGESSLHERKYYLKSTMRSKPYNTYRSEKQIQEDLHVSFQRIQKDLKKVIRERGILGGEDLVKLLREKEHIECNSRWASEADYPIVPKIFEHGLGLQCVMYGGEIRALYDPFYFGRRNN